MGTPDVIARSVPAEHSDSSSNSGKGKPEASFMGIPLTRWAVVSVSAIVVAFAAFHFGFKIYQEAISVHLSESSYASAVTLEIAAHKQDSGAKVMIHEEQAGQTWATYFSDGCIAISRPGEPLPYLTQAESHLEWSLAPSRRPTTSAPHEVNATPMWDSLLGRVKTGHARLQSRPDGTATVNADVLGLDTLGFVMSPAQNSCLNPHPGEFRSWWGQANGCWVPFWRQWSDGCTHSQMYNTCAGQWDTQINWTFCAAQHHS